MAKNVKPRTYRSPLREQQARETRARIREAADALFRERGYVATSIDDVARAAGVARQTVFSAFGSKGALLKEAIDVRLVGDDEPVAMEDRPEAQRVLHATDPRDAIRRQAKLMVETTQRTLPLWPAMTAGATVDPELAELVRFYERGMQEGPTVLVDVVADLGALRRGRSRRKAKEAMYLLVLPSTMHAAVALGWSPKEIERWLAESLEALLLEPSG
jgi:AcrR family transcriptional regulator